MTVETYLNGMKEQNVPRGALGEDNGFSRHHPETWEPAYLPESKKLVAPKPPPLPEQDLTHLNDPRYVALQKNVKNFWKNMTPEQLAAAKKQLTENAKKLTGYKRGRKI